jgi:glycosyltransferase involved in cell wall biosynthesis
VDDLVCISHVRWDYVWQRPQHLLSRLAHNYRVLFVEEPIASTAKSQPSLEVFIGKGTLNLTVIRLIQPVQKNRWIGHSDPLTQRTYNKMLTDYLNVHGIRNPILWLYTPMASEFVSVIPHKLLIFDAIDQLSGFKGAPAELIDREENVLQSADAVFTGGISLYRDKRPFNRQTYLFPNGVDVEHFASASTPSAFERPADLDGIPAPILGYWGVVDERVDFDLLAEVARQRPDWHFVLIGPISKIEESDLPQASNLHYLGMKAYNQLPAYLAYFDVALIPFGQNDKTRYVSPTKTLEYMAAHKPIVSTPIHDVVELYDEAVRIARTPDQFIAQVEDALNKPETRSSKVDELLALYSWDNIAQEMFNIIQAQLLNATAAATY